MADLIDFKMFLDDTSNYTIKINPETGDVETTAGADTSIINSLGTDARANESEMSEAYRRRGYIGDEVYTSFKHGSKLWLLDQSRITQTTKNDAVSYARDSLKWLVNDKIARSVTVTGRLTSEGIYIDIVVVSDSNRIESFSYNLFKNTLEVQ